MTKWVEEDKELAKLLLEQGMTVQQVSNEIDIPFGTINNWKLKWGIKHKNSYKEIYTGTVGEVQERLIELMRAAPEISYSYFNSADSPVPPATTYRKYFGSWSAAMVAAGVSNSPKVSVGVQKAGKCTTLYLVEFEDFYKIGITQQTVHQRLGGRYPRYKILAEKVFDTPYLAKVEEKRLLQLVKPYKYIPTNFPVEGRGFTECFKISKTQLEAFFQDLL